MYYFSEAIIYSPLLLTVTCLFLLIVYLLKSFGLFWMAKSRELPLYWLAFVPIVHNYILGEIIYNRIFGLFGAKWILLLSPLIIIFLTFLINIDSILYSILIGVYYITITFAYYYVYRIYSNKTAFLLYLSGFVLLPLNSLWIFLLRKKKPLLIRQY